MASAAENDRIIDAEVAGASSQPTSEPNLAQRLVSKVQQEVRSNAPAYIEGAKTLGEVTAAVVSATTTTPKDGLGQNLLHWGLAALAGGDAARRTVKAKKGEAAANGRLAEANATIESQNTELTELREGTEEIETTRRTFGPFVRSSETKRTKQGYRMGANRNGDARPDLPALGAPDPRQGPKQNGHR